jgi:D-alanyl-D-alanine dipeptidase
LLDALTAWTDDEHAVLADLGYAGENNRLTCPIKNSRGVALTVEQRTINALHSATRALAERGNSLLKTAFKALRRVTLWWSRTSAAVVIMPMLICDDVECNYAFKKFAAASGSQWIVAKDRRKAGFIGAVRR